MVRVPASTSVLATTRPFQHRYLIHRPRIQTKPYEDSNNPPNVELALSSSNDASQHYTSHGEHIAPDASKGL